ncbi:hypothetical protein M011DRAFT_476798 [Sporormia fimetaria CBS 119925]|uniref:DUF952-domain-containing protein n=1 Tax=Sporormia fimetaria CBS 119925 TaxID=1340428 RepID=A0A6A6VEP1_9PLEO|nr:hypothetical protein M011DRAFT_476798 [Sporormia fimetaria CBS 119925]
MPNSPPSHLYKILPSAPPSPLPTTLPLSPLDKNDGYIHLSTAVQVPLTASRFFSQNTELWLLVIKTSTLEQGIDSDGQKKEGAELKWEDVNIGDGNTETFPHYYGAGLGSGNVGEVKRVERGEGWSVVMKDLEW